MPSGGRWLARVRCKNDCANTLAAEDIESSSQRTAVFISGLCRNTINCERERRFILCFARRGCANVSPLELRRSPAPTRHCLCPESGVMVPANSAMPLLFGHSAENEMTVPGNEKAGSMRARFLRFRRPPLPGAIPLQSLKDTTCCVINRGGTLHPARGRRSPTG